VLTEGVLIIAFQLAILEYLQGIKLPQSQKGMAIYPVIFALSQVFQIYLLLDAAIGRNSIELIAFVWFHYCCFVYSILQIFQVQGLQNDWEAQNPGASSGSLFLNSSILLITSSVILGLFSLIVTWLAYKLFQDYGWDVYKHIGADIARKNMLRRYHILLSLLKLDLFFFVGFALQFLILVLGSIDIERGLTIAALPIVFVTVFVGAYAARNELKEVMLGFLVCLFLALAYFVFKLVRIYTDPNAIQKYYGVGKYLTAFAAISCGVCVGTIYYAILRFSDFGKGLKPYLINERSNSARSSNSRLRLEEDDDDVFHAGAEDLEGQRVPAVESPKFERRVHSQVVEKLEQSDDVRSQPLRQMAQSQAYF